MTELRELLAKAREQIVAIDHPCHEVCVGNLHADCQCAAWLRQEAIAVLDAIAGEAVDR